MKTPKSFRPEFIELAKHDPALLELESFTKSLAKTTTSYSWMREFYGRVKPRVCSLVGFDRCGGPAELKTMDAYDTVYQHCCLIMEFPRYR